MWLSLSFVGMQDVPSGGVRRYSVPHSRKFTHGQVSQKIVERPIYPCVNFLYSADALSFVAEYFLFALKGHSIEVRTPQRDDDLESRSEERRVGNACVSK